MNRFSSLRPLLLLALAVLLAPLARAQTERVALAPCVVNGAPNVTLSKNEAAQLQKTCVEQLSTIVQQPVKPEDVDKHLKNEAKGKCAPAGTKSKDFKERRSCLASLATATGAEYAALITFIVDKAKVTSISGLVVDQQGTVMGPEKPLTALPTPATAKPTPRRDELVRTAVDELSKTLPVLLGVKLKMVRPELGQVVVLGEKVPVLAQFGDEPKGAPPGSRGAGLHGDAQREYPLHESRLLRVRSGLPERGAWQT